MAAGREHDFARAYDAHLPQIYGFFGYRVGSRAEAEDLTQATFERALRAWGRFDPRRASVKTWLFAIARNLLIDHHRRRRGSMEETIGLRPQAEIGDRSAIDSDETRLGLSPELEVALNQLGERERELIALRYGGELTGAEIARLTGLSLANVHQILSRTLRLLRERLEAGEGQPPASARRLARDPRR